VCVCVCVCVVMRNNNNRTIVRTSAAARIISRSASSAKLDGSFNCACSLRHCADGADCTSLHWPGTSIRHSLNVTETTGCLLIEDGNLVAVITADIRLCAFMYTLISVPAFRHRRM
jgi:hypothetical protein